MVFKPDYPLFLFPKYDFKQTRKGRTICVSSNLFYRVKLLKIDSFDTIDNCSARYILIGLSLFLVY